ncbi:protein maelstrom homolog [Cryptotermes secundus]|uniref:protein maelstrom homolog n=1 Tax=Cryptotermes secundus TaxID=105785 RepID=UPI001454C55C|nr:protein maelstrom homolog [Cryptotermes secundus]XP_033611709.1 protein maelstrom homolog [Cryptotermes secundus]
MTMDNTQQTEKESPEEGFDFFFLHVQKKVQERGAPFISEMAASMWEHMAADERWGYEEQARNKEHRLSHVDFSNAFRPRRTHCAWLERLLNQANRQNRMFREIEETVRSLKHHNSLKTHLFHLVHVNYCCKDRSGRYLGCEIALVEFSFVDGVTNNFHAFINPGDIPLGYASQAFKHATETHPIPLPPDGFGSESHHQEILSNIRFFLMGEDGEETNLPPLYTSPGDIEAVESVLCLLNERPGQQMNAGRDNIRVYSVCKLFHELRNASMGVPSDVILSPNFLDERELIKKDLKYAEGISRDFHELQTMRHCSLWHLLSWSTFIVDECCGPLAIEIVPEKHLTFSSYLTTHVIRCCNQKIVPKQQQ